MASKHTSKTLDDPTDVKDMRRYILLDSAFPSFRHVMPKKRYDFSCAIKEWLPHRNAIAIKWFAEYTFHKFCRVPPNRIDMLKIQGQWCDRLEQVEQFCRMMDSGTSEFEIVPRGVCTYHFGGHLNPERDVLKVRWHPSAQRLVGENTPGRVLAPWELRGCTCKIKQRGLHFY